MMVRAHLSAMRVILSASCIVLPSAVTPWLIISSSLGETPYASW